MEKHVVEFEFEREHKHTIRYQQTLPESGVVTTIYVQKWAVKDGPRWVQKLKVTVEEGE